MASKSFVYVNNPDIVTIDNEKSESIPYEQLDSILKEVKYIPLVSKEPIGEFRKVLIYKERIYVLDATVAEKIFIFNIKGEIIKIIDSKGGGPEEYRGLIDMTISMKDDYLVINDRLALYTLYFTLDGEFVKKNRSIANSTLAMMGNKIVNHLSSGQSFDDNVNYNLVVTVGDSITRKGFPIYPLQVNSIHFPPLHYNYRNELLFCPDYCDTVYWIINDSTYTTKYIVKHSKSVWEKWNQNLNFKEYAELIFSNYTALTKPILETENFVYYPVEAKMIIDNERYRHHYPYWFNKKKKQSFSIEQVKLEKPNPVINHIIPEESQAIYGNHYAGIIDVTHLESHRSIIKQTEEANYLLYRNQELRDMIMDENPNLEAILVLYEFKDSW
jgi:hypothetical protein